MKINFTALLFGMAFSAATAFAQVSSEKPYYFQLMQIAEAHKITRGNRDVKVAILSTGVNYRLAEFSDSIDVRSTGTGMYPDDIYGADVFSGTGDPMDHPTFAIGTAEAGLIASRSYGVSPGVSFFPVRIMSDDLLTGYPTVAKGIEYAVKRGAKIIQVNVGGPANGDVNSNEYCAALRMAEAEGVLVVASGGNSGSEIEPDMVPHACGISSLVTVTSVDSRGVLADFGSWDFTRVSTAAPGVDVPVLSISGGLMQRGGSSFSSALAAGVAALVMSAHPEYSIRDVKEALIRGSDLEPSLLGKVASNGRLNAYKALTVKVK